MKELSFDQMESTSGGHWLNNHTFKEHLVCVGHGILASPAGPLWTAGAMILCYAAQ